MPTITVGSKTLTIPQAMVVECAAHIKKWYNLPGSTPQEILDAWSAHTINEVKAYLKDRIGNDAYGVSMEGSEGEADAAKDAAEAQAEQELIIT